VIVAEPISALADDPPANHKPRHERRRPGVRRASRPAEQPMTVDAITNAGNALTSLADRSLFEDETQGAIDAGAQRLCLLRIGLDEFDEVNRVHGHQVCDEVLVVLAERLRNSVRPNDLTGRLGWVDFAVLFEDVRREDLNTVATRMLAAVRKPLTVAGRTVFLQASVGIAEAGPADDASRLLLHATDALAFARITAGAQPQWYAESRRPAAS
jgi:diguanylate cyclase (GGDEF)-like protein